MFCGNCGNEVDENAKFCPKCGSSISNTPNEENNSNQLYQNEPAINNVNPNSNSIPNTQNTSKRATVILTAIIIIGILAIGIFVAGKFLFKSDIGDFQELKEYLKDIEYSDIDSKKVKKNYTNFINQSEDFWVGFEKHKDKFDGKFGNFLNKIDKVALNATPVIYSIMLKSSEDYSILSEFNKYCNEQNLDDKIKSRLGIEIDDESNYYEYISAVQDYFYDIQYSANFKDFIDFVDDYGETMTKGKDLDDPDKVIEIIIEACNEYEDFDDISNAIIDKFEPLVDFINDDFVPVIKKFADEHDIKY